MRIALLVLLFALDLNTATVGDLQTLPGIGPALAKRIVEFREKKGGFRRVEELLAVPGISEKKWQAIKAYVYVRPRTFTRGVRNDFREGETATQRWISESSPAFEKLDREMRIAGPLFGN